MTPNEINKRLRYFSETKCKFCNINECKEKESLCKVCIVKCIDDVLNLINQYESEIERLQDIIDNGADVCGNCHEKYAHKIAQSKSDAIKDFTERLKECFPQNDRNNKCPSLYCDDYCYIIDNLVEEMVGEGDG